MLDSRLLSCIYILASPSDSRSMVDPAKGRGTDRPGGRGRVPCPGLDLLSFGQSWWSLVVCWRALACDERWSMLDSRLRSCIYILASPSDSRSMVDSTKG